MSAGSQTSPWWRAQARRAVFALVLAAVVGSLVQMAAPAIQQTTKEAPTALEKRHLALTEATRADLTPSFEHSVSGPLKKLAPHRTDGVVQPLWPWFAAWWPAEGGEAALRERTAWFRLGLAVGVLVLLGVVCVRNFSFPAAVLTTVLVAWDGFLPTVAPFTGAAFFHLFYLLTWLAVVYALQRNSLWVHGVVGVMAALAYISEDRVLPMLLLFGVVSTLRALWGWLAAHWQTGEGTTLWVRSNHLFGLFLLLFGFLTVAGPRLAESQRQYGQGFFHYVDQVRWLDDAATAQAWMERHPDAASLAGRPPEDRLNATLYRATHAPAAPFVRVLQGLEACGRALLWQGGPALLLLTLLLPAMLFFLSCGLPMACHAGQRLHPETATTALWIFLTTVAWFGVAAWDAPVWGLDHLQAVVAPLGLSLVWGCESIMRRARRRGCGTRFFRVYQGALWLILAVEIYTHLPPAWRSV